MLTVKQLSKRTGISTKTLQRWDREGKLIAERTETGRRVYGEGAASVALALKGTASPAIEGMTRVKRVMISPFDIPKEAEWECDENNVQHLMGLMRTFGFTQSLFLWDRGNRVIDGLHRAEAARRLKIEQVPADVFDGSEEEFWAQRINSALKHYTVTDERLGAFIAECWLSSGMYVPLRAEEVVKDYRKFGYQADPQIDDESLLRYSAARSVWETDFSTHRLASENVRHRRSVNPNVAEWFVQKGEMWRIPTIDLKSRLLTALGFEVPRSPKIQQIEAKLYLNAAITFAQRVAIIKQVQQVQEVSVEKVEQWASKVIEGEVEYVPLKEYKTEEEVAAQKRKEIKKERDRQVSVLPVGQHRIAQGKLASFERQVMGVSSMIKGLSAFLREPTAEYIPVATKLLAALHQTMLVIPDWNINDGEALRIENAALKEQIKELQAKVNAQQPTIKPEVLAVSSTEIEAMG